MKVSVAMCTFNGAKYIESQLQSILLQKYAVEEIVVCDDGSSDETMKIVSSIVDRHKDINWVIRKNECTKGVVRNFEQALGLCHGDVIFLSDQDDVWERNKTEEIVSFLENNDEVQVVFTDAYIINEVGDMMTECRTGFDVVGMNQLRQLWENGMHFEILNVRERAIGATMALRRDFLQYVLPFNQKTGVLHDARICAEAVKRGCLAAIYKPLMKYRIHGKNTVGLNLNKIYEPDKVKELEKTIVDPINGLRDLWGNYHGTLVEGRICFYKKRYNYYYSFCGKLKLIAMFPFYVRYYRRFACRIYVNDIFFGMVDCLRNRYVLP